MRTIDASDLGAPLPFEIDHEPSSSVPPRPASITPAPRYVRRCHRDGLELDAFGDCARCAEERREAEARANRRGRMAVFAAIALVVASVIGVFVWSGHEAREGRSAAAAISAKHDRQLVVYTMNGCGACAYARQYMDQHGIAYVERRIDGDPTAYAELESLHGRIVVPTFVIGDEVMTGMDPTGVRLERAIDAHEMRAIVTAPPQAM